MDIQVSLVRILIGDNSRTAPTYSDSALRGVITFGPIRPTQPIFPTFPPFPTAVLLGGIRAAHVYPSDNSGGPWKGDGL